MVELVDTPDLKSCALWGVRVQVPLRVLKPSQNEKAFFILKYLQRGFHPEFVGLPNFHKLGFFIEQNLPQALIIQFSYTTGRPFYF